MGLQKDWGVFNLFGSGEGNAYDKINIEVMTDGDTYVENTATSIMHAASSPYKELDAIQPLLSKSDGTIGWDIEKYGSNFKKMLTGYYPITKDDNGDLWSSVDSYLNYINQFNLIFENSEIPLNEDTEENSEENNSQNNSEEDTRDVIQEYSNTGQQYFDYKANIRSYDGKHYIKRPFSGLSQSNYIRANIDLFHFSKYYNIYAPSPVPIPAIRPLIYDEDMLDRLGITIDTDTGMPHINNLILMDLESNDSIEMTNMKHVVYDGTGYDYTEGPEVHFTRGVHSGMSMFKSCPQPDAEYFYLSDEDEFYNFMPEGFSLFAIWGRSAVFNGDNKTHSNAYVDKTLPNSYTSLFKMSNTSYYQWVIDNDDNLYPLVTLVYFGDQKQNIRIFNNYFPVKKTGHVITDEISYSDRYKDKKISTISMALVSVLANIYVYNGEDTVASDITYISDCVFLAQNTTMYTKDIVYKAYVQDPQQESNDQQNSNDQSEEETTMTDAQKATYYQKMLLFQKIPFNQYIDAVKTAAQSDKSIDHVCTAKDLNVSPDINACIKNVPIQLNINYLEPNIEAVGQISNQTRVFKIDSNPKDIYNWTPETNKLYQLTLGEDGEYHINSLRQDFAINYLKDGSLTYEDHKLKGVFSDTIPQEINADLHKTFKYDADGFGFIDTKANGQTRYYYSISTKENWYPVLGSNYSTYATLKFIPKNDVLIPFAKMMQ